MRVGTGGGEARVADIGAVGGNAVGVVVLGVSIAGGQLEAAQIRRDPGKIVCGLSVESPAALSIGLVCLVDREVTERNLHFIRLRRKIVSVLVVGVGGNLQVPIEGGSL